jgi:hypothetical protein
MAIALVANTALRSTTNNNVTTAAIDTTGATLLVVVVADQAGVTTTLTDSKTNTWTGLTVRTETNAEVRIFYAANPTVGTGHTFTGTSTGGFPALAVLAFSGVATVSPFDVQNGVTQTTGTSVATGSITPTAANEVLVGGISLGAAGITVSSVTSPMILQANLASTANAYGVGSAYEIQTTATARNLTWVLSASSNAAAAIASFKEATAAASRLRPFMMQHSG